MKRICTTVFLSAFLTLAAPLFASDAGCWFMLEAGAVNIDLGNARINTSDDIKVASFGPQDSNSMNVSLEAPYGWTFISSSNNMLTVPFSFTLQTTGQQNNTIADISKDTTGKQQITVNSGENAELFLNIAPNTEIGYADDYFAFVTLTLNGQQYPILMSAYYGDKSQYAYSNNVIFSVMPTANARSIDIKSLFNSGDEGVEVATYSFASTSSEMSANAVTGTSPYYIYALGSAVFDDERAPHFYMTNIENQASGFQYNVVINSYNNNVEPKVFSGYMKKYDTYGFVPTCIQKDLLPNENYAVTYHDSGSIRIVPSNADDINSLSAGYYSSDIYLHVVSAM